MQLHIDSIHHERTLDGLLKSRAGMPPKARAKGVAAKATAKATAEAKEVLRR